MSIRRNNARGSLVLIVDDDKTVGKLIRSNLEGNGIRILEVTSGLDCVKVLHQEKVDLVILDIKLPDFSGWGILGLIRLTDILHSTPVIVVSVEPREEKLIEQLRPYDYIQKPFDIRELVARVHQAIYSRSKN